MSDPKSVPFGKDLYCQETTARSTEDQEKPESAVVMLNGFPVPTAYADKCRLCLGDKFNQNSSSIIDIELRPILRKVFSFPITNKIGLPMNVCGKCNRKVRLFNQYHAIVAYNQSILEAALFSAAVQQKQNNYSTSPVPAIPESSNCTSPALVTAQPPVTNVKEGIAEVIDIASDDEASKEKEDEAMDAELPSLTTTADTRNDPLFEPPDFEEAAQTHFVSVASQDAYFFYNETDGTETLDTPHTDFIKEASIVIELESSNDEESNEGSRAGNQMKHNRGKNVKQGQNKLLASQSFTDTRLQAAVVVDAMKNVNKSKKCKR